MGSVPVEIATRPSAEDADITFVDDVDSLGSTEVVLGCGNTTRNAAQIHLPREQIASLTLTLERIHR